MPYIDPIGNITKGEIKMIVLANIGTQAGTC